MGVKRQNRKVYRKTGRDIDNAVTIRVICLPSSYSKGKPVV